jgi:multimeric flavodoxin WrbA
MKVLVIAGGRINGNTQKLAGLIARRMETLARADEKPFEYEVVNLAELGMQFCRGCRVCFEKGEALCPCQDGVAALATKMDAADGLILASPVYVEDASGAIKNWIDRMAYNCYRPAFSGKLASVITTSGVSATSHSQRTMATALRLWGYKLCGRKNFRTGARMTEGDMLIRHGEAIDKQARRLYSGLNNGSALRPSVYSLIAFTVQQYSWRRRGEISNLTQQYWQQKGWLDKGRRFYMPHRRNVIVSGLARAAGLAIARFFVA